MKKIHNISACLAIFMASLSLFSCSSEDDTQYSTAGQLGDISVDRTKIGTHQWFTISSSYVPGSGLASEKIQVSIDSKLPTTIKSINGELSAEIYCTTPGKHTITLSAINNGLFTGDATQQVITKTKQIEVVASDIRCNFWYDTREETMENLSHYTTRAISTDGTINIVEDDIYGDVDYSSEAKQDFTQSSSASTDLKANRYVSYKFDANNKLNQIEYICTPQDQSESSYFTHFLERIHYMQQDYNCSEYVYNTSNVSFSEREKNAIMSCLEKMNNGETKYENLDPDGLIVSLMQNKALMFICQFTSKDNKTKGAIGTYYDWQNEQYSILFSFSPMN